MVELARAAERDLKSTRRKQLEELIPRLEAFGSEVGQVLTPAQAKVWKKVQQVATRTNQAWRAGRQPVHEHAVRLIKANA